MKEIQRIVDFHAHILPSADHGSSSLDTSLFQLECAKAVGVNRIIATPHFYPHLHTVDSFIQRRDNAYLELMPHLDGLPEVRLGAEALICPGFEHLPDLDKLLINGTNSLLLELPLSDIDYGYCDSVKAMTEQGIDVILAHADRYHKEIVDLMIKAGARLQLNASSLIGVFKRGALYEWLENNQVAALGSDIHGRDKSAYPNLVRAFKKIGNSAEFILNESELIWDRSKEYNN